jgi:hypothetical protein
MTGPVERTIAQLFMANPLDYQPGDVELIVAHYREARDKGHFRPLVHKAIAAGKPPPRPRKPRQTKSDPVQPDLFGDVLPPRSHRNSARQQAINIVDGLLPVESCPSNRRKDAR